MDEVDEALSSDQLINVQVDYQSIRDVLSELTVQLDRAQHSIHDLQQHRELDALLTRLDKMEEHVQQLASQREVGSSEPSSAQQMQKVEATIDRKISDLEGTFKKMFDEYQAKADTKGLPAPEPGQFVTVQAFNALLNRVNDLEGMLRERAPAPAPATTTGAEEGASGLAAAVDLLKRRVEEVENEESEGRKAVRELEKSFEALSQRIGNGRGDDDGAVRSRGIDAGSEKDLRTMIIKEVMPELEQLRERNKALESQVQEQNKLIEQLKGDERKKVLFDMEKTPESAEKKNGRDGEAVGENDEDEKERINKLRLQGRRASHQVSMTPGRGLSRYDSSPASVLLNGGRQTLGTPTEHTSFRQLSNHVNDIDTKFTEIEGKLKDMEKEMEEKFALLLGLSAADEGGSKGEHGGDESLLSRGKGKSKQHSGHGGEGGGDEETKQPSANEESGHALDSDGGKAHQKKRESEHDEDGSRRESAEKGNDDVEGSESRRGNKVDGYYEIGHDEKVADGEEAGKQHKRGQHHKGVKELDSETKATHRKRKVKTHGDSEKNNEEGESREDQEARDGEHDEGNDEAYGSDAGEREMNARQQTYSDEYEYEKEHEGEHGEGERKRGQSLGKPRHGIMRPPIKRNELSRKPGEEEPSSLSDGRVLEDFTVEDIGKLLHDVRVLQRHVRQLNGEIRRLRGEDLSSSQKGDIPALGEDQANDESGRKDGHSDGEMDSEPETGEREKHMELRINTPGSEDKSGTRTPQRNRTAGSAALQRGMSNLEDSMREMEERYAAVQDRLGQLTEEMRQTQSRVEAKDNSEGETADKLRQEVEQLRLELDQRLLGLTPQMISEMGTYAPLPVVKKIAVNFQRSVDELERQMGSVRDFLKNLVSKNDLEAAIDQIQIEGAKGETAGGRLGIRCLLCGKPANCVTGMIMESEVARMLGPPPQCGVSKARGSDSLVLTYGRGPVKPAKRATAKNPLPPMKPPPESP